MESILDSMDFHGATQAYLWGIPIASFANLQYYSDKVWKFRQGELVKYTNLNQKLGILTANATTPYIVTTVNLSETGPFVIDLPAGAIAGMVLATRATASMRCSTPLRGSRRPAQRMVGRSGVIVPVRRRGEKRSRSTPLGTS